MKTNFITRNNEMKWYIITISNPKKIITASTVMRLKQTR